MSENLREQQNVYHPQDCTGDVHHGFCGGGARIVGFENGLKRFALILYESLGPESQKGPDNLISECRAYREEGRGTRNGYEASKGSKGYRAPINRGCKGSRQTPEALRGSLRA